jgi:hypothetical protein
MSLSQRLIELALSAIDEWHVIIGESSVIPAGVDYFYARISMGKAYDRERASIVLPRSMVPRKGRVRE